MGRQLKYAPFNYFTSSDVSMHFHALINIDAQIWFSEPLFRGYWYMGVGFQRREAEDHGSGRVVVLYPTLPPGLLSPKLT